eukprot:1161864-Pelagomonas_calceolata.AAC.6
MKQTHGLGYRKVLRYQTAESAMGNAHEHPGVLCRATVAQQWRGKGGEYRKGACNTAYANKCWAFWIQMRHNVTKHSICKTNTDLAGSK